MATLTALKFIQTSGGPSSGEQDMVSATWGEDASDFLTNGVILIPKIDGAANEIVKTDGAGNWGYVSVTGSGNVVKSASPTLTGTIIAVAANLSGDLTMGAGANILGSSTSKLIWNTSGMVFDGATGELGLGTATPDNIVHARLSQDAGTHIIVENPSAGVFAHSGLIASNGPPATDSVRLLAIGTGFTNVGGFIQDSGLLVSDVNLAGGLVLMARGASTGIKFYTGGNTDIALTLDSAQKGTFAGALDATGLITANAGIVVSGGFLNAGDTNESLTLSGGVVTATMTTISIDTEASASSDDCDTINGNSMGRIIIVKASSSARTVVMKDGTGNLRLAGDFSMDHNEDRIVLISKASDWVELCRSNNNT